MLLKIYNEKDMGFMIIDNIVHIEISDTENGRNLYVQTKDDVSGGKRDKWFVKKGQTTYLLNDEGKTIERIN